MGVISRNSYGSKSYLWFSRLWSGTWKDSIFWTLIYSVKLYLPVFPKYTIYTQQALPKHFTPLIPDLVIYHTSTMDTSGSDFSYPPLSYYSHILPAILPPLTPSTADIPISPPDYRPLSLFPPREQWANGQLIPAHSAPSTQYAISAQTSIPQTSPPSNPLYQSQEPDKQEAPRAVQVRGANVYWLFVAELTMF